VGCTEPKSYFLLVLLLAGLVPTVSAQLVIAHRGASGYLPEHTMEAKVMAFSQGADYLEQDVVMTRDDKLVVMHDLTLERTTNVEEIFPDRARADGSFYVIDFTLAELRTLSVGEGTVRVNGADVVPFPGRFPPATSRFAIHTLEEELELVSGLRHSTGRTVGIYPELKSPWFHHQHGKDISTAVLKILQDFGYKHEADPVYLQSFDYNELVRVKTQLLPALGMNLKLVQLIAENEWGETQETDAGGNWVNYDYSWMHTEEGIRQLALTVSGLGPAYEMLLDADAPDNRPVPNTFVDLAHANGMEVHPYTFRQDRLPSWAGDFSALLDFFIHTAGVDGVFTDFPDLAVAFRAGSRQP
jgi:glycerophosphoryl diester phosphodiesterase